MIGFFRFFTFQRQFVLFVICLISIPLLHMWAGFAGSWLPVLIAIILLVKHILIGSVNAAAMQLQDGDFEGAEKTLTYTWRPDKLKMGFNGMYYLIKARVEFQKKNYELVEKLSKKALSFNLQDDFKAMVYLQLINIYGQRRNTNRVKEYLQKCKKLNVTQEMIKMNIQEVEKMVKGTHDQQKKMMGKKAQRSMMNQGFQGRGKKRR